MKWVTFVYLIDDVSEGIYIYTDGIHKTHFAKTDSRVLSLELSLFPNTKYYWNPNYITLHENKILHETLAQ